MNTHDGAPTDGFEWTDEARSSGPKVLHVYRTYFPDPPGGLQEAIRQIARSTRALGASPAVFTLTPGSLAGSRADTDHGPVFYERSWAAPASCDLGGPAAFARFTSLARCADVIHLHFPWPFADLLHWVGACGRPAVLTYHSDIVRQRWALASYGPLMRRTLRSMHAIVATSPQYARTSPVLRDRSIAPKVSIVPLALDESLSGVVPDDRILARTGLVDGRPFVLFVGVLRYYKGLHALVDAAPHVPATIVIAGEGPERKALEEQVRSLGATNVVFLGRISDAEKSALLHRAAAMVLPSHLRSEAFGMSLLEGAAHRVPLVSCEIGTGTTYVNVDGVTGLVVPPESPDRLAAALRALVEDHELRDRLGAGARARYEALFGVEVMGRAYMTLYGSAVASPPAR